MSKMLNVGLYGAHGHQLQPFGGQLLDPRVLVTAVTPDVNRQRLADKGVAGPMTVCDSLQAMLAQDELDLVSLCSDRRADQPAHALACLEAGVHVYAEKPAAFDQATLDRILATAQERGLVFREMAGTADTKAYEQLRQCVVTGSLGEIIQVTVQKSYPWHDRRPSDEAVDGGLIRQVGVHAFRMVEHVACQRVVEVTAWETSHGNPRGKDDGCAMAASFMAKLQSGAVASVICNYANPNSIGVWGNDEIHVFGSAGMAESLKDGRQTRLVLNHQGAVDMPSVEPPRHHFQQLLDHILDGRPMRRSLNDELHPTRVVIQAKANAHRLV